MKIWAIGKKKLQTSMRICLQVFLCWSLILPFVDASVLKLSAVGLFFCFNYFIYPQWGFWFTFFYSCSFCSLLFWYWFPFDMALVNGLLIQAPFVYFTGTTCHHYLAEIISGEKIPRDSPL